MTTEKQHTANRANAQHSTGPVTPEGKAASSLNGTTHGLSSHRISPPDPAAARLRGADVSPNVVCAETLVCS